MDVNVKPTPSWSCTDPDGDKLTFTLYFGESKDSLTIKAQNITTTSYTFTEPLKYNTTYYWQIEAKDPHGAPTKGPIWQFTTIPQPKAKIKVTITYSSTESGTLHVGTWGKDKLEGEIKKPSIDKTYSFKGPGKIDYELEVSKEKWVIGA
jgi:hypothetical protein